MKLTKEQKDYLKNRKKLIIELEIKHSKKLLALFEIVQNNLNIEDESEASSVLWDYLFDHDETTIKSFEGTNIKCS